MSMRRFLMDNTNFEKETFNTRGFVFQVEKEFGRATVSGDNPYDVDPVSFIRFKQGYDYVVDAIGIWSIRCVIILSLVMK